MEVLKAERTHVGAWMRSARGDIYEAQEMLYKGIYIISVFQNAVNRKCNIQRTTLIVLRILHYLYRNAYPVIFTVLVSPAGTVIFALYVN